VDRIARYPSAHLVAVRRRGHQKGLTIEGDLIAHINGPTLLN
jgi:hypothetical protein